MTRPEHQLIAILCADVKDYSRHMQNDEAGTVRHLQRLRQIFDSIIAGHHGRIANTAGDSVVAEFASIQDAVACAVAAQKALAEANSAVAAAQQLRFRIGLHMADVIRNGSDILGDGVNLAARIEGCAEAGGIAVSRVVHDSVRNKLPYTFIHLGEQQLKNIAEPVSVYALQLHESASPTGRSFQRRARQSMVAALLLAAVAATFWLLQYNRVATEVAAPDPDTVDTRASAFPRIVVLPFRDLSPGGDQQALADGTSEEVSNLLTTIPELTTIGQISADYFRNAQEDFSEMRERLDVDYVLTGSVRRSADDLRIGVQLVDAQDGQQVWYDNFDGTLAQSFEFQEDIAAAVANALQIKLGVGTLARQLGMTDSVEAWEAFEQRKQVPQTFDRAMLRELALVYERTLALDPDYTHPAMQYLLMLEFDYPVLAGGMSEVEQQRANELRTLLAQTESGRIGLKGTELIAAFTRGDYFRADQLALELDATVRALGKEIPMDSERVNREKLMRIGRSQEALVLLSRAYSRDPLNVDIVVRLALVEANTGNLQRAVALLQDARALAGSVNIQIESALIAHLLAQRDPALLRRYLAEQAAPAANAGTAPSDMDLHLLMLGNLDDRAAALDLLRDAVPPAAPPFIYNSAAAWANYWDAPELALDYLSASAAAGRDIALLALWHPIHAASRKLPGFQQLVTELGLADYWQESGTWSDYCKPVADDPAEFACQ